MSWAQVSIVFLVAHMAGDFLFQTDWQARHKAGGLGRDGRARRALFTHLALYTAAFVPALVWIAVERGLGLALAIGALIYIPHLIVDDARLLRVYLRRVKRCPEPVPPRVAIATDQSVHVICLWGAALVTAS